MKEKLFKKGITRRLFSVVLALAMVLTLLPMNNITVFAGGGTEWTKVTINGTDIWYKSPAEYMKDSLTEHVFCEEDGESYMYMLQMERWQSQTTCRHITTTDPTGGSGSGSTSWTEVERGDKHFWYLSDKVEETDRGADVIYVCSDHGGVAQFSSMIETWAVYTPCEHMTENNPHQTPTHSHNWGYSLVGTDTIKAVCSGDNNCTVTNGKTDGVTLTLTASSANYSGSATYSASLEGLEAFKTATGLTTDPTITYYSVTTAGSTTGGTQVTTLTGLDIGNYYASVTVGGQTAVKAFKINDPNAPTTFTVSFNANGGSGTMSDVTGVVAGTYTLPTSTTFTAPAGKVFDGWSLTAGGTKISGTTTEVSGNITLYAVWKNKQGGGTGGGSGSGSGGGGSYTPSPAPTPSTNATIGDGTNNSGTNISVNTSNGNATVSNIPANTVNNIANNTAEKAIVIDVSKSGNNGNDVTKVTIPKETVETIAAALNSSDNNKESLIINTNTAAIKIDATALASIADQAKAGNIQLVVENKAEAKLNNSQKSAVDNLNKSTGKDVVQTFEAYFVSGGTRISSFGGGEISIGKLDFDIPAGKNSKNYHVYYISEAGVAERYPTWVENGSVYFRTTHLSDYAIVYDETLTNGQGKEVYRLWNHKNGDHLLTTNPAERDACQKAGWRYEGVAFIASEEGKKVYRLYNPRSGEHFYTTSEAEKNACIAGGWRLEGVAFTTDGTKEVYRLYGGGMHLFTTSKAERDNLVKHGWKLEGVGFKAN